jgi:teichuronic acid biosynthesis glycosyltransferase TuaC
MRVLVVTNMYPSEECVYDGIFVKEQVEQLRRDHIEVDVLQIKKTGESFIKYLFGIIKVKDAVNKGLYDIIHFHYGLTGFSSLGIYKTPIVITFHGSDLDIFWQKLISFIAGLKADLIVTQNYAQSNFLKKKSVILPCGVNINILKKISTNEAREILGLDANKKFILFPANPNNAIKNYSLYSKIIFELRKKDASIEELILHNVKRSNVFLYYCASDCCVLTSDNESGPIVAKEALYLDCPFFSVDVGDVKTIFGDLAEKFIIPRNPTVAAQQIFTYLTKKEIHSFSLLVKDYTLENTGKKLIEIYNGLLQGKN